MAATSETIRNCVEDRLGSRVMTALRGIHGENEVESALALVGEVHAGCEEIGSSDVSCMVEQFLRTLPKPKLELPNYETNDTILGDIINAYTIIKWSRDAGIEVGPSESRAVELRLVSALNKLNRIDKM